MFDRYVADLWLVRHGESTANAGLPTESPSSSPLTELGRSQAQAFADNFTERPRRIFVSPFLRAQQTADPLLNRLSYKGIVRPIQEWTFLSPEKYFGTTQDQRRTAVLEYIKTAHAWDVDGPGAESFMGLLTRAYDFLEEVACLPPSSGPVIAFTHGRFIKAILWRLKRRVLRHDSLQDYWEFSENYDVPNVSVTRLKLTQCWSVTSPA